MDIFTEYMVKKKKTVQDYLVMTAISVFGTLLVLVLFVLLMGIIPQIASLGLLVIAGIGYGIYWLITSFNLEFEYSMVNYEIDVDKIINVRRRKRLTTVNIRGLEAFGTANGNRHEFESYLKNSNTEKIYACRDKNDGNVFYAVYQEKEKQKMLLFNPNEKMLDTIKKLNPQKAMFTA